VKWGRRIRRIRASEPLAWIHQQDRVAGKS
jgi:hypothetical protein